MVDYDDEVKFCPICIIEPNLTEDEFSELLDKCPHPTESWE